MNQPKPWVAIVLSLLSPGLGHVYTGRVARAVIIVVVLEALGAPLALLFAAGPINLALLVGLPLAGLAILIGIAIDASRFAKAGRRRFLSRRSVITACISFFMLSAILNFFAVVAREHALGKPYRIPSGAMFPTLLIGDHLFTNPLAYRTREVRLGDIVIVIVAKEGSRTFPADRRPELPQEHFVKRIVGLPGDRVAFKGPNLVLNGVQQTAPPTGAAFIDPEGRHLRVLPEALGDREYWILDSPDVAPPDFGPLVVEPGRIFVAGDNRDHSKDSRFFGTVSRNDIIAPTSRIYWSWDFNGSYMALLNPIHLLEIIHNHTRWSRIGMPTN